MQHLNDRLHIGKPNRFAYHGGASAPDGREKTNGGYSHSSSIFSMASVTPMRE